MLNENTKKLKSTLKSLDKDISNLLIRSYIRSVLSNYQEEQTYIIYDNSIVEVFNLDAFDLKRTMGSFKTYYISKPLKSICVS